MKKLMMLLFGACLVFSLAMPVLAQDAGAQGAPQAQTKETKADAKDTKAEGTKTEGKTKSKKATKSKKGDEKKTDEAPKQ